MMYRVIKNLVDIRAHHILIPTGVHTRGHANRYLKPFTSVNAYKFSSFSSGIRLWNSLPDGVMSAPSLEVFQTRMGALHE
ncbi:hypothetical protein DPMN_025011 [Dreissena polymorpha]|uniref:Uncharacterized protein n=1 Tax=Dreissena polymorpha TaxID=45954 RepID=A0A9D4LQG6_DREPO|nr:hypothetical protein DPMN_025011 [Dreissena polymorpha]